MRFYIIITALLLCFSCSNQNSIEKDKEEILKILNDQQKAWSKNDIKKFMDGYWESDSLMFYSGGKLKTGWQNTLKSYQKSYPNASYTGNLKFEIANISQINKDAYWVMGEYHLIREKGNANGTFMIIFKRIHGKWKIIADSSC